MALDFETTRLTGVSLSPDMPIPALERRQGERHIAIYRSAKILVPNRQELCLLRNISAGGLMGEVESILSISTPLTVELKSGKPIKGQVVWTNGRRIGVKFDRPIDVMEVLHAPIVAGRKTLIPRMPRLDIVVPAVLSLDGKSCPVTVRNISQGGVNIECGSLVQGTEVAIEVTGLDSHRGRVCWIDDLNAGISFFSAIPFRTLARWAVDR